MTELFPMVPANTITLSAQVKQIMFLISDDGRRWPCLRREEYLALGLDYTSLDWKRVVPSTSPGYELRPEDVQYTTPEAREWFTHDVDPLLATVTERDFTPEYQDSQLLATMRDLEARLAAHRDENVAGPSHDAT